MKLFVKSLVEITRVTVCFTHTLKCAFFPAVTFVNARNCAVLDSPYLVLDVCMEVTAE